MSAPRGHIDELKPWATISGSINFETVTISY